MKNLTVAALIGRMLGETTDDGVLQKLQSMLGMATKAGVAKQNAGKIIEAVKANA